MGTQIMSIMNHAIVTTECGCYYELVISFNWNKDWVYTLLLCIIQYIYILYIHTYIYKIQYHFVSLHWQSLYYSRSFKRHMIDITEINFLLQFSEDKHRH